MSRKIKTILFSTLLLLFHKSSVACGFHFTPPFGANWFIQPFADAFYLSQNQNAFGIQYYQRNFRKAFIVSSTHKELREELQRRTFYYHYIPFPKFQCILSVTSEEISTQAADDAGKIINLKTESFNQIGFTCRYMILQKEYGNFHNKLFADAAFNTSLLADNNIISRIGWLGTQTDNISPRIIAGTDKYNYQIGATNILKYKEKNIFQTSFDYRMHATELDGFNRGNEFNISVQYKRDIDLSSKASLMPSAGLLYEHGYTDWQTTCGQKDVSVFAEGSCLLGTAGLYFSVENITLSARGFFKINENIMREFQLLNAPSFQIMLQYRL